MKKLFFFILLFSPIFAVATAGVDLNLATPEDLDTLKGVGPALAQRIIEARPFSSVDDLVRVKGIGEKTLQNIKEQDLACVDCAAPLSGAAPTPNPTPETIYPAGIIFSEILPSPKGADETDEWFELFNTNDFEVDLSGWKISDATGTIKSFTIPAGTEIYAGGYLLFGRPVSKIMLNNDGDGLSLLQPNGVLADSVNFPKAPTGQSYNKTSGSWAWSIVLTPNKKNIISAPQSKNGTKTLPKEEISVKDEYTAGLNLPLQEGQVDSNTANPWILFFSVLGTAIVLATGVLFIKLKNSYTNVRT